MIGAWMAFALLFSFGFAAYLVVFIVAYYGVVLIGSGTEEREDRLAWVRPAAAVAMVFSLAAFLQLPVTNAPTFAARKLNLVGGGGILGEIMCARLLLPYVGYIGSIVVCIGTFFAGLLLFTRFNFFYYGGMALKKLGAFLTHTVTTTTEIIRHKRRTVPLATRTLKVQSFDRPARRMRKVKVTVSPPKGIQPELIEAKPEPSPVVERKVKSKISFRRDRKRRTKGTYKLPGLDLLNDNVPTKGRLEEESLQRKVEVLQSTLKEFGIEARVGNIIRGPVITRYEVHPAPGVKVQKITTLADDLALAMAASSIRIVAPIPGKSAVGIEIPNSKATFVGAKEMLVSREYSKVPRDIPLAIGKEISGSPIIGDLADMPHLLIAGSTGSGKTVCINSIILTILFSCTPAELKLLLIDPKRVEMTQYRGVPHLLAPVITEPKKVVQALCWAGREMERRYALFSEHLVRNIKGFNVKAAQKDSAFRDDDGQPLKPFPYIVIIIDELADLMLVARKDIEDPIIRLAQMGRAAGIHIILATQRPSVNVITGLIKANFPTRIAFRVATKVDSKVILDSMGAEKLLGRGDMLYIPPGSARRLRIQGTLVDDSEINRTVDFVKALQEPEYEENIFSESGEGGLNYEDVADELYDEAVNIVMQLGQASASMLQRRMRVGYTRAARLVDMMEERGIVGPAQGSKPREVLAKNPRGGTPDSN
jgi:S-DNA-T family DNA segregation ATPase FtsK/SpoIIIE